MYLHPGTFAQFIAAAILECDATVFRENKCRGGILTEIRAVFACPARPAGKQPCFRIAGGLRNRPVLRQSDGAARGEDGRVFQRNLPRPAGVIGDVVVVPADVHKNIACPLYGSHLYAQPGQIGGLDIPQKRHTPDI